MAEEAQQLPLHHYGAACRHKWQIDEDGFLRKMWADVVIRMCFIGQNIKAKTQNKDGAAIINKVTKRYHYGYKPQIL